MAVSVYTWILGLGAMQGLIMGGLLITHMGNYPRAQQFLALLLFFFSYRLLVECGMRLDILGSYTHWSYHILLEYNWIYGPLLYLFVRSYAYPDRPFLAKDRLHFLPVGLEFLFSNWVKTQNFYWDGNPENLPWMGAESYVLWVQTPFQIWIAAGLLLAYAFKSQALLRSLEIQPDFVPNTQQIQRIHMLLWVYSGFAALVILLTAIDYLGYDYSFYPFYDIPMYSALAILTYGLGIFGYLNRNHSLGTFVKAQEPLAENTGDELLDALQTLMDTKKPYLAPDLHIEDLAKTLNVKSYVLRKAVNQVLNQKFPDYLNTYRVEAVIRLMQDPAYDHYSLLGLSQEAGFNSKATFNRSFKKQTGISPGEYRKRLKG